MRYKVLIQKCGDPRCAGAVAFAVARHAGVAPEKVFSVITEKTICVRKKARREEALTLKKEFETLGATVDLVTIDTPPAMSANLPPAPSAPAEDDEETPGRILSEEEYAEQMRNRTDIFYIENNRSLNRIESICLVVAVIAGIFMSTQKIVDIAPDFIEKNTQVRTINVTGTVIDRPVEKKQAEKPKTVAIHPRKSLRPESSRGSGGKTGGGGGNPYERVAAKGLIGMMSGMIKGADIVSADIFGKGGYTKNIDAILLGMSGLKSGMTGGTGRAGPTGIGFGPGYNSGFDGDGPGGIGDPIGSLFENGSAAELQLKPRTATLRIDPPTFARGGALPNGRSRQSIARVVQQNIAVLRHAYNQRLREKPGLKGKITVRFAIDEFGKVLYCSIEESSIADGDLEKVVLTKISRWKFDKIDKVGDVTEVIYPFVFSQ